MKQIFAEKKDLSRLLEWCKDVPEYQKSLCQYIEDRADTAVVIWEEECKIAGVALLKVKATEKKGTIWIYTKDNNLKNHPEMMQCSLKWLRQKGAKDYTIV
jgi:hypothetical protein